MQALGFICSYYFLLLLTEIQINLHALNECNNAPSHKDAHEDRKPSQDIEFQKKKNPDERSRIFQNCNVC